MHRRPNPTGIELAVAAGLAVAGVTGFAMGRRILHPRNLPGWWVNRRPTPSEPEAQERSIPELPPLSTHLFWMHEHYPGAECHRSGEAYGYSVTGPEDGFAMDWVIYLQPLSNVVGDERWLLVYNYQQPHGSGGGTDVFHVRADAFAAVAKIEGDGFQGYRERQAFRGDPNVGAPSTFTSVTAC